MIMVLPLIEDVAVAALVPDLLQASGLESLVKRLLVPIPLTGEALPALLVPKGVWFRLLIGNHGRVLPRLFWRGSPSYNTQFLKLQGLNSPRKFVKGPGLVPLGLASMNILVWTLRRS